MLPKWQKFPLETVLDTLIDYRGKTPVKQSFGVPLITAKIVKNGRIEEPNEFISEEDYKSWMNRGYPNIGDVIITTEAPVGEVAQLTNNYVALAQRVILLRGKTKQLDNTYLKYCLMTDFVQSQIHARGSGTTVFGIKQSELRKIEILVPPVYEQKSIAKILSSFDDKIELNRKMNATLEQIAQTIFKSWFVDFDPVKAKAAGREPEGMDAETAALFPSEFEQSELGMIPKGWEKSQLGEICYNYRETVSPEKLDPKTLYIGLEHIPRKSIALDEWSTGSLVESGKSKFVTGDILFGKLRPYFHKVGVASIDGICSTDILVIRPKRVSYFGIALSYLASEEIINYADRFSNGAKMPRVNWKDLAVYEISIPPEEIAKIFSENISCIVEKIKINILESKLLRSIREIILPRLIAGQLRMPDVEKQEENYL